MDKRGQHRRRASPRASRRRAATSIHPGWRTVGGEINKLASNVGLGRMFAGVHWRADYTQGLLLGEAAAISVLKDQENLYGESLQRGLRRLHLHQIRRQQGNGMRTPRSRNTLNPSFRAGAGVEKRSASESGDGHYCFQPPQKGGRQARLNWSAIHEMKS